ncbi:uncharacterized protein LOC110454421 [Mizuhopecten yessoensis]|uniref:Uncharacterized protein n=1 Tax=Mizuhopecten yessoensis TaxID=6573 RepID=A0A210QF59_MIZYE|nr:uncharacterized protein LOC110454421 [Mizuhopecten yessoensis]OWF47393.1 hypothetical protein KP79_PYT08177 [Mizuhopecten yessoensis]
MKSLFRMTSTFVGENMDLFPTEAVADLPGPVLESILPYMSAYWLHSIHQSLSYAGVKCDWLWTMHIRRRWGLGVQSMMNVFQETIDKDPRKVYLMKHFHDLLNFCTLSVNTRDPHSLFHCPIHRLVRRETLDPRPALPVPRASSSSSSQISFFISNHHDGGTVGPMSFHLDQLLNFSAYAQTLRVLGSQCGWIASCTPLLEKLLQVTERLQLVTLTDTYYTGIRALVVSLMKRGTLTKVVLSTVKLSEPCLLDLMFVCSGRLHHTAANLSCKKNLICQNCAKNIPNDRKNTQSSVANQNEDSVKLNDDSAVLDESEASQRTDGGSQPVASTSSGIFSSQLEDRTMCSRSIEPLLWEVGFDSDGSESSNFDIPDGPESLLEPQILDLYDEAITPLPRPADTLENLVLTNATTIKPGDGSTHIPLPASRCVQCNSCMNRADSVPGTDEALTSTAAMQGKLGAEEIVMKNDRTNSTDNQTKPSCHGNQMLKPDCDDDMKHTNELSTADIVTGLESFALLSTANRYDISSILVRVLPGWTSLKKFGVFDVDMKSEELTLQLLQKVQTHQLSHLVLDDISVHPSFFQKFLHTLHTDFKYGENSQTLELLDFQACTKPIEISLPLSPGVLLQGVRKLDLSMNTLSESGFAALLNLVKNDLALVHLKLNGCFLQEEQVLQLLEVLAENTRLEVVSLSGNRVVEESVEQALVLFIEKCVSLKTLVLNYSRLRSTFVSSEAFIQAVRGHPSLQELSIKNNHLESGALNFLIAITCSPQRPALRSLNIGYNWIKGQDLIEAAQRIRSYQRRHFPANSVVLDFLSLSGNRLLHSFQQQLRHEYRGLVKDLEANSIDFSRPYAEHVGQM